MRPVLQRTLVQGSIAAIVFSFLVQCSLCRETRPESEIQRPRPVGGYEALAARIHYPAMVRESGIEGTVIVNVRISDTGLVTETRLQQKLLPELDQVAIEAIRNTQFEPAMRDQQPVSVWISIPIVFDLYDWQSGQTPFSVFRMFVRPNLSFQQFDVELFGQLKSEIQGSVRFEILLPAKTEKIWIQEAGGESPESGIIRDEGGNWLIFECSKPEFSLGFSYPSSNDQEEPKFKYSFAMNHALPDWDLSIIYGDQSIQFTQSPNRMEKLTSGETQFVYDLESLEPYEIRHFELGLVE